MVDTNSRLLKFSYAVKLTHKPKQNRKFVVLCISFLSMCRDISFLGVLNWTLEWENKTWSEAEICFPLFHYKFGLYFNSLVFYDYVTIFMAIFSFDFKLQQNLFGLFWKKLLIKAIALKIKFQKNMTVLLFLRERLLVTLSKWKAVFKVM